MVRLAFHPYTQVWQTICTSVMLRASTRVSPGFTLLKCSSPPFGSYQICSYSNPSPEDQGRSMLHPCGIASYTSFRYAFGFFHPNTRILDRLLGPCFKTGQLKPFWQNLPKDPQAIMWFFFRAQARPGRPKRWFPHHDLILPFDYDKAVKFRYLTPGKPC